jgi:dihydrolipoamide dehydrogenase
MPIQIQEIGNAVEKYMRLDGINVMTKSRVEKIIDNVAFVNRKEIVAEKILVCIGRKPNVNPNELNDIGIRFDLQDGSGGVSVDEKMRTNIANVYAIGDVTGMYELAHVASKQGEVAAENIMGRKENNSEIDYRSLPVCVFTYPEVAFVGDLNGRSGEFSLAASAKANCLGDTRGIIKVFENEGKLVGTYIIAPHAGEIIAEAALAIKMKLRTKDIFDTIHAHPTLPESFAEAVRDISSESIHHLPMRDRQFINRKSFHH